MDTSKSGASSHHAGAVVAKLAPGDGLFSVLAFPYTMKNGVTQMRVPGGGSHEDEGEKETYEDTLRRELEDEISKKGCPFALKPGGFWQIHHVVVRGQDGASEHHKVFFLVPAESLTCTLRRGSKLEDDGEILGEPAWYEVEGLVRKMFEEHTPKHHIIAVLKSLKITAEVSPSVAVRYATFLESYEWYLKENQEMTAIPSPVSH